MINNIITLSLNDSFHESIVSRLEEVLGKAYYITRTHSFEQFVNQFNSQKVSKPIVIVENCLELNDMLQIFYPEIMRAECPLLNPTLLTPNDTISESLSVLINKSDNQTKGFRTNIKGMTLLNLIYIYVLIGENRHLRIIEDQEGRVGFLKIGQSKISAARTYDSHGLIALIDMLQWESGRVEDETREIEYEPIDAVLIDGPQALMHAVHAIDESNTANLPSLA